MTVETRLHPETGTILRRGVRPLMLHYRGQSIVVDMPGWYPDEGEDSIHSGDDMAVSDRALAELKARVDGVLSADEVRIIRKRLKLSQRAAGELLGGGPRAFQKYESNEVLPSAPMSNLLRLLSNDPRRLDELKKVKPRPL